MSINPDKRKCSAVCSDGHPCQAWAVIESDPPLCPVHAGLNRGAGAPIGNQNALKHGLYRRALQPDDVEDLETVEPTSLMHELVLVRIGLLRVARILGDSALQQTDMLAALNVMPKLVRTIIQLQKFIGDSFDWEEVLDEVGADWEIEI